MKNNKIVISKIETIINYKLLTISDNSLVLELDKEEKLGFELYNILERVLPSASSDFCGYKILFRRIKK